MSAKSTKEKVLEHRCPSCQSKEMHVYHYLREGHHGRMYLECSKCGYFLGRVIVHAFVEPDGHADYRLFLKQAQQNDNQSARKTMEDFRKHAEKAQKQFEHVKSAEKEFTSEEQRIRDWYVKFDIREDG